MIFWREVVKVSIYHNPRCSKSRQTLALLEAQGINPDIVEYLKDVPNEKTISHLLDLLGLEPRDLMRKNEDEYKALKLNDESLSRQALIKAMSENAKLIERPIVVVDDKRAAIGRPPESVLDLFK